MGLDVLIKVLDKRLTLCSSTFCHMAFRGWNVQDAIFGTESELSPHNKPASTLILASQPPELREISFYCL
jgi:hypothetical protein